MAADQCPGDPTVTVALRIGEPFARTSTRIVPASLVVPLNVGVWSAVVPPSWGSTIVRAGALVSRGVGGGVTGATGTITLIAVRAVRQLLRSWRSRIRAAGSAQASTAYVPPATDAGRRADFFTRRRRPYRS